MTPFIRRDVLARTFDGDLSAVRAFEQIQQSVSDTEVATTANVASTQALKDASVLTLSPNDELANERVVSFGSGLAYELTDGGITIKLGITVPRVAGGFRVMFTVAGDTTLGLPLTGILATRDNAETFTNKELVTPAITGLGNYANDAAAATGGVPVGGAYRNGSVVMVRVA